MAVSFIKEPSIQDQIIKANDEKNVPVLLELIAESKQMCQKIRTSIAQALWADLGEVPVNNHDELKSNWLIFDKGDDIQSIWYWFERTFNISLAFDL